MIDNILFKYMDRLQVHPGVTPRKEPGPVITISREYGCFAGEIAEKLTLKLSEESQKAKKEHWTWISKEIINAAAQKLQTSSNQLKHFFDGETSKFLADIIVSFSKSYASDDLLKRTVSKVVKTYSDVGNVIIVGRAGFAITKDIQMALHIKLIAPLEWRIKSVAKRYDISLEAAKKKIEENDKKRDNFVKVFCPKGHDNNMFHVVFNHEKLSSDEIIDQIMLLAKERKFY